jgi:hypothetical protein
MKMSAIQEMRARGLAAQPKKPSHLPIIAGGIGAFAGGALLVMASGAVQVPSLKAAFRAHGIMQQNPAPPVTSFASATPRLGRAASAPLLRQCMPYAMLGMDGDSRLPPGEAYAMLKVGSQVAGMAMAAGLRQNAVDDGAFATLWGEVADCIYKQNGSALCDADNRALAVEAANVFVRQSGTVRKKPASAGVFEEVKADPHGRRAVPEYSPQQMQSVKDRVLSALRTRLERGYLIAADFGSAAPQEVNTVLTRAQTERNSCAETR